VTKQGSTYWVCVVRSDGAVNRERCEIHNVQLWVCRPEVLPPALQRGARNEINLHHTLVCFRQEEIGTMEQYGENLVQDQNYWFL